MATSLLTLLDDITSLLDDVAALTKVSASKTVGVLGDDLALNAQQVAGMGADRELPVIWSVAKGSALNKLILVPVALLLSLFLPWAVTLLLLAGGLFLCFEGAEKVSHKLWGHKEKQPVTRPEEIGRNLHIEATEKERTRGAIRTDFILSAEVIVISLGTVAGEAVMVQLMVLSLIAAGMTVGVYGLVAGIVKIDDAGLYLSETAGDSTRAKFKRKLGLRIVQFAPVFMRWLTIIGTAAMFLVGGGIIAHNIPFIAHFVHIWEDNLAPITEIVVLNLFYAALGLAVGAILVVIWKFISPLIGSGKEKDADAGEAH